MKLPGIKFFSLQKGEAASQKPPEGIDWIDFSNELKDFADTAALVQNLDLVISVDTSTAHLGWRAGKAGLGHDSHPKRFQVAAGSHGFALVSDYAIVPSKVDEGWSPARRAGDNALAEFVLRNKSQTQPFAFIEYFARMQQVLNQRHHVVFRLRIQFEFPGGDGMVPSLRLRPPSLKPGKPAVLDNYRLCFPIFSEYFGGGIADIVYDPGKYVAGALFDLSEADLKVLDAKSAASSIPPRKRNRHLRPHACKSGPAGQRGNRHRHDLPGRLRRKISHPPDQALHGPGHPGARTASDCR